MALPTLYDLTDPASNLAELSLMEGTIVPDILEQNRFLMGAEFVPALFAGAYGFRRNRAFLPALLWAFAGYMAPLPTVGVIVYESATGVRAFGQYTQLEGYSRRYKRPRRRRG